MIPYVEQPVWHLGALTVTGFGVMVVSALFVGMAVLHWRSRHHGFEPEEAGRATLWMLLGAFALSHVFAVLAYAPEEVRADPFSILDIAGDMSAAGGMAGGFLAALAVGYRRRWSRNKVLDFLDIIAWGFVFGWIFGRLGCALAHDHKGVFSTLPWAVRFPEGPRLDLGLIESGFTLCIAAFFVMVARVRPPRGFYVWVTLFLFAGFRLIADQYRVGEVRLLGLTPTQYAAGIVVLCGLFTLPGSRSWVYLFGERVR